MAVSNSWLSEHMISPNHTFAIDPRSLQSAKIVATRSPWQRDGLDVNESMLGNDVFKVPVEALVDIWVLRFGHSWVNLDDIENDEFFKLTYTRLKSLGQLEVHYLTDRAKYVCRKPE